MRPSFAFLASIALALPACSSNPANPPPPADSGAGDATSNDSDASSAADDAAAPGDTGTLSDTGALSDTGTLSDTGALDDASDEDALSDAGLVPTARLIASGSVIAYGFTSDGYLVYSRDATLYATPVGGGPARSIVSSNGWVPNHTPSSAVPILAYMGAGPTLAGLGVWTAAGGYHVLAPSVIYAGPATAVSPDGKSIAYVTTDGAGTPTAVMVANTDGTGTPAVLQSIDPHASCSPRVWFGSSGTLLAAYCPSLPDGGSPTADNGITEAFDGVTHAMTASVAGTGSSDPTGAWLWMQGYSGSTSALVSTSSGASVSFPFGSSLFAFDATGARLFYCSFADTLIVLPTATPATRTTLLDGGCSTMGKALVSPDGSEIVAQGTGDAGAYQSYGISTTTAGAPWSLAVGAYSTASFTADSRYILAASSPSTVAPASGGAATLSLSDQALLYPTTGSSFVALTSSSLALYDASGTSPATTLAVGASTMWLSGDVRSLAYPITNDAGTSVALYLTTLP